MLNKMIELAKSAMGHAYCPYSNFKVGSCVLSDDDQLFMPIRKAYLTPLTSHERMLQAL